MSEQEDVTLPFRRELMPRLQAVVERLESLASRLGRDRGTDYVEDLVAAVNELTETRQHMLARASHFEELMAEERSRYRDLFDHAPDAYIVTDQSGLILEANAAASQLFDQQPSHLLGEPLPVFVALEARPAFQRTLAELAERPVAMFEVELETETGRKRVEARARSELGSGRPPQLRWIMRDVTARKAAEAEVKSLNAELERRIRERTRALTDASARLETILQQMPHGVLIVDMSGDVQMANPRAEELTGKAASELGNIVERPPWRMYGRDGRELEQAERPLVRALESGDAVPSERIRVVRPDGVTLVLDISATPVRGATGIDTVLNTFQDVTAQEARERAERDFVTNAAHELQTPLAAITSAIDVLQAGAKERPEERERFLGHIAHASERLTRLTHALLVLARAQTSGERPRREVIAVQPLLEGVAANFPHARKVAIECESDIAVIGNRPLLEQALLNLGENAIKHTTGDVAISAAAVDGRVSIVVRDEGPGIGTMERELVFQRFYRNGRDDNEGFGLGLAIVAEVARALDGELELESSASGTSIGLTLPSARIVAP